MKSEDPAFCVGDCAMQVAKGGGSANVVNMLGRLRLQAVEVEEEKKKKKQDRQSGGASVRLARNLFGPRLKKSVHVRIPSN